MSIAALIREMAANGASIELIAIAVEALEKREATRKRARRAPDRGTGGGEVEKRSLRRSVPASIQREVYKRDGLICRYCGTEEGPFELDHVVPWSRGGTHSVENLVVSCKACNREKRNRTPQEMGWMQ